MEPLQITENGAWCVVVLLKHLLLCCQPQGPLGGQAAWEKGWGKADLMHFVVFELVSGQSADCARSILLQSHDNFAR